MAHSLEQVSIALRSWSEKNVSEKKLKLKISFSVCPLGCSQHSKYEAPIYAYYIYIYMLYTQPYFQYILLTRMKISPSNSYPRKKKYNEHYIWHMLIYRYK